MFYLEKLENCFFWGVDFFFSKICFNLCCHNSADVTKLRLSSYNNSSTTIDKLIHNVGRPTMRDFF